MKNTIYFDMDGTIADLYGCENWLDSLINEKTKPYREAKSMVDMRKLGKLLNALKANGYEIGIVSWLSKSGTDEYNARVTKAKTDWLARHLGAVEFDEIHIVKYGTPKHEIVNNPLGILFADEKPNRDNWLARHLGAVEFDEIHIVKYGTPKETVVNNPFGILFDDETKNRENWLGTAYDVNEILEILSALL